ncbi:SDR family NAD(P)-dependent oxidoreductase [Lentzea waywayandensis]|uniref:SDR family NAD(P)-dependent oxidoreductase n=1 Tax=Lentzea waywayandensis TaxID=84724 RepID=UPI001FECCA34|nr:SDR family NAD(P)-dependent oxidoreductase [Lentzea waywayandensis]
MRSRVALVTGGGSGIGQGIALAPAAQGHRVAVLDRVEEAAHAVAGEIREAGLTAEARRLIGPAIVWLAFTV